MRQRASTLVALLLVGALLAIFVLYPPLPLVTPDEHDRSTVTIHAENGTEFATVDVEIANTSEQRRVGLSRHDTLENGTGMLFVHSEAGTKSYHMRNMSFGIDIVFIDSEGTITTIHDAPHPDVGGTGPYRGTGQYVLEVPRGYMASIGACAGDYVEIPEEMRG